MTDVVPRIAGRQLEPERRLFLAAIERLAKWPETIDAPSQPFIAFVAMDAREVGSDEISDFAQRLLEQGVVYVCAWGPDCERVHDLFDEAGVMREISSGVVDAGVVMTTWHDDEKLDAALQFALFLAVPDDQLADVPADVLAVVVGRPDWAEQVERRLSDARSLDPDALEPDSA